VAVFGDNDNEMSSSFGAGGATVVVGEFLGPEVPFKYVWSATTKEELSRFGTRKQPVKSPFKDCST
jgi:hypothetical protein